MFNRHRAYIGMDSIEQLPFWERGWGGVQYFQIVNFVMYIKDKRVFVTIVAIS